VVLISARPGREGRFRRRSKRGGIGFGNGRSSERGFRGRWLRPVLAPAAVDAALSPSSQGGASGFSASRSPARSWARRPASWRRPRPSRRKTRVRANALKAPKPAGAIPQGPAGAEARGQGPRASRGRSGSARVLSGTQPTHPTLVRTSARTRSTDQASRSPRGFADALSIIPSGRSGREDKGAWAAVRRSGSRARRCRRSRSGPCRRSSGTSAG
jgi:hypothetical protein